MQISNRRQHFTSWKRFSSRESMFSVLRQPGIINHETRAPRAAEFFQFPAERHKKGERRRGGGLGEGKKGPLHTGKGRAPRIIGAAFFPSTPLVTKLYKHTEL